MIDLNKVLVIYNFSSGTDSEFQLLQDQKVLAAKPDEKVENKFTNLHFFLEPRSGMARVPILNIPLICLARVSFGEPDPGRNPVALDLLFESQ